MISYTVACLPSSCRRPSPRVAPRVFSSSTPLPFHGGVRSRGGGAGLQTDDFEKQKDMWHSNHVEWTGISAVAPRVWPSSLYPTSESVRPIPFPCSLSSLCVALGCAQPCLRCPVAAGSPHDFLVPCCVALLEFTFASSLADVDFAHFFFLSFFFVRLLRRYLACSRPPPFFSRLSCSSFAASLSSLRFPLLLMVVRSATDSRQHRLLLFPDKTLEGTAEKRDATLPPKKRGLHSVPSSRTQYAPVRVGMYRVALKLFLVCARRLWHMHGSLALLLS